MLHLNKKQKRYSFALSQVNQEAFFDEGENPGLKKKIIFMSITAVLLLGTLYVCVGYFAHPDQDAALTSAAESTTEFSKKLGGKRKYFVIFGVVIILLACHKYEVAKKIIKALKPEKPKTPPAPPPEELSAAGTAYASGVLLAMAVWTWASSWAVFELAELAGVSATASSSVAVVGVAGVVSAGGVCAIAYLVGKITEYLSSS